MPIPYAPITDEGTGFLVSLFKAAHHLHNITVATAYGWKITAEQAAAELGHVAGHAAEVLRATEQGILANQTVEYVRDWYDQTQGQVKTRLDELKAAAPEKELPKAKEFREPIKAIEQQTWALLAYVDQDLLGWQEVPDAGRKP